MCVLNASSKRSGNFGSVCGHLKHTDRSGEDVCKWRSKRYCKCDVYILGNIAALMARKARITSCVAALCSLNMFMLNGA
jgi:hypothetical protein